MITKITTTDVSNSYVFKISGVTVTVTDNFKEKTSKIDVEPKITGGALDTKA